MTFVEGPLSVCNSDKQRSPGFLILYPKALPLAWVLETPNGLPSFLQADVSCGAAPFPPWHLCVTQTPR